jgi:ATP-dependent Clp protease ATP-binding subunit ClpA
MFERFTEGARQVVVLAQEESRLLGHNYIGTEHLLLGVLRQDDEGVTSTLAAHGITLDTVRADIVQIVGPGNENTSGQIPFTPRAKKVLELSLRESQALSHGVIAPLHLTLALAREGEGVAAHILQEHGLEATVLERVLSAQEPYGLGADVYKRRLAVVEARLAAWEHRAELIEIAAAAADGKEAEALVAQRLGLTDELARDVLNMRLQQFDTQHVRGLRQERESLREQLGD